MVPTLLLPKYSRTFHDRRTFFQDIVSAQQYLNINPNGSYLLKIHNLAEQSVDVSWNIHHKLKRTCYVCHLARILCTQTRHYAYCIIWTTSKCQDFTPATQTLISMTFKDQAHFPGPGNFRKKSSTFQDNYEAWRPCFQDNQGKPAPERCRLTPTCQNFSEKRHINAEFGFGIGFVLSGNSSMTLLYTRGDTMATNFGTKIDINAYKCISTRDNENVMTYNRGFSWWANPRKISLTARA